MKKGFIKLFALVAVMTLGSCSKKPGEQSSIIPASSAISTSVTPTTPASTPSNPSNPSTPVSTSTTPTSPYTMKITPIGSTTIAVSKTVQLRSSVTGTTQKDVTWSSMDESIATVATNGLVTGVGEGQVEIKATLNIDPNCFATIKITVEGAVKPTSVEIQGLGDVAWVDESIKLRVGVEPSDAVALVDWSVDDETVASITEDGMLTGLKEGQVIVTCVSTVDNKIMDAKAVDVKYGVFYSNVGYGIGTFDISHQADEENPYVEILGEEDDQSKGYNTRWFNHVEGQYFYVKVDAQGSRQTEHAWDWQGFGVGSGLSDSDARYFEFSPHFTGNQDNNFNKCILRERPDSWNALTDRSQIWGKHGLDAIDYTEVNSIAMLRYENYYYYLINDEIYYCDITQKYDGIDTKPFVFGYDMPVKFTNFQVVQGKSEVEALLEQPNFKKSFYASNDFVNYYSDSSFTINSVGLARDYNVWSLGDKALLNQEFEVEFDFNDLSFQERDKFTGLTINFSRYDTPNLIESIGIGASSLGKSGCYAYFGSWNYAGGGTIGYASYGGESASEAIDDLTQSHHVKIKRTIDTTTEKATFHVYIDGSEEEVAITERVNGKSFSGPSRQYLGACTLWIGAEYASVQITNLIYR